MKRKKVVQFSAQEESPKQTLGAGLANFAKRYGLNSRKLSAACGGSAAGVSKSSADRILRGVAELRVNEATRLVILENLRRFLSTLGKGEQEIDAELKSIFYPQEVNRMIAERRSLPPDAVAYFHLRHDPFDVREPRQIGEAFTTKALDVLLDQVSDAINYQSFLAVIGEIGSGKSTLKRRLIESAEKSRNKLHVIWPDFADMERVTPAAIVATILEHFGQRPRQRLVTAQRQLKSLLAELHDQGVRVALGFDEAHRLNDTMLSALKNFYELGTGGYDKFLGVVLFGQPRFKNRMYDAEFQEIAERLEIIEMPKFSPQQAWDYVAHRVRLAGGDAEKLFERAAVTRLAAQSTTPLGLGNLCNAALIKARTLGERKVLASMVKAQSDEPAVLSVRRAS